MPKTELMIFFIMIGIAFGLTVITDFSSNTLLNSLLAIIALIIALLALLSKNYSYLLNAILKRKGAKLTINATEPFFLSPSGTTLIRREGEKVYASAYIKIPVYKSATDMGKDEKTELSRLFGRILTLSKIPMKLSAQLYVINKDEYITKIRNMLNEAEEKYRSLQGLGSAAPRTTIDRARGEVTMWRNLLDNVSKSQSQSLVLYAMVSALGSTDEEASNIAYQRAMELSGGVSALLGVNASLVTGQEILKFVEPDYMIPVETVNERIKQKVQG